MFFAVECHTLMRWLPYQSLTSRHSWFRWSQHRKDYHQQCHRHLKATGQQQVATLIHSMHTRVLLPTDTLNQWVDLRMEGNGRRNEWRVGGREGGRERERERGGGGREGESVDVWLVLIALSSMQGMPPSNYSAMFTPSAHAAPTTPIFVEDLEDPNPPIDPETKNREFYLLDKVRGILDYNFELSNHSIALTVLACSIYEARSPGIFPVFYLHVVKCEVLVFLGVTITWSDVGHLP